MKLESPFKWGDRVIIDGDKSLVARCLAFNFRAEYCEIEIGWIHNGTHQSCWVANWRLSSAPEQSA